MSAYNDENMETVEDETGELSENLGRGRRSAPPKAGCSVQSAVLGKQSQGKQQQQQQQGNMSGGDGGGPNKSASEKVKELGINNTDMMGVKDWVTQRDDEQWKLLPQGVVAINVSHSNLKQKMLELKFDLHQTIGQIKARLHLHHGTPSDSQRLTLRDGGVDLCKLDDDSKMLGFYSVQSGMELHVLDVDPHSISRGGALENTDLVEKFRMSEDAYDKRKGTVREWIREQRAADPNWEPPKPNAQAAMANTATRRTANPADHHQKNIIPDADADAAAHVSVGDRCEVQPGGRRGAVAFVGDVAALAPGPWVGVVLDEPLGKHDGSVFGAKFFDAPMGHGTFVRPKNVSVGDYPDISLDDSDDEL